MKAILFGMSLRNKVLLLALGPLLIFDLGLMFVNYTSTKNILMREKQMKLKDILRSAEGALLSFHEKAQRGELSEEGAKELAKGYLKKMRYGTDGDDYVWVNDFEPKMIVHPSPSLEGENVSSFKDKAGSPLFLNIVKLAKKQKEGFVDYLWHSKKDESSNVPKLSYIKTFEPWGWILGSGIYVEDVEAYINDSLFSDIVALGIGMLVIGVLTFLVLNSGVIAPLLQIAQALGVAAQKVTDGSEESLQTSQYLSNATNEQAASLQETVASVEEISAMITRNSESAEDSRRTSEQSQASSEKGKATVEEMLAAIMEIADNNDQAMRKMEANSRSISEILEIIKKIEEKTKIINDIVFQTKLLSFNASVEAARAGESGKGFAVVAEEVGSLASMSGTASEEIRELLDKSINQVEGIVADTTAMVDDIVRNGAGKVDIGTRKAQECKQAFDCILVNVRDVGAKVEEIALACKEQSVGVGEISEAMRSLDAVTHRNNDAAQKASTNAQALKSQSDQLDHAVRNVLKLVHGGKTAA